jgi:septum formation protein
MVTGKSSCKLILASQSPRRKSLLSRTGIKFCVVPAQVEEPPFAIHQDPREYANRLALMKAAHVSRNFPKQWVLGADTIVVIDSKVLGKPATEQDARRMLTQLSGNTHQVMTGCVILSAGQNQQFSSLVSTEVTFKTLSDQEIDWYVASGEPFDKAGGYAIQGLGAHLVKQINGSYTNVVGLPLCEVVEFLDRVGLTPFSRAIPICPSQGGTDGPD